MSLVILIGLGGATGSISRYLASLMIHRLCGQAFPYGTLAVNAIGSFLIGFLLILLIDRFDGFAHHFRSFLVIGFLGGFTTFSAFSFETMNLIENNEILRAILNIFINVSMCLCLTWIGIKLGRQL